MASQYAMTKTGTGTGATWTKIVVSTTDYRDTMWGDLLKVAENHWNWVKGQPNAYTALGSCLVAVLFLPSTAGGVLFLATIPRDTMFETMMAKGATNAPAWWRATTGGTGSKTGLKLHAEDLAEYLFETSAYARGIVQNNAYHTPDRDNHHSRMKIGVWGRHKDSPAQGECIALCTVGLKTPKCITVANTLNVAYATQAKVRFEEDLSAAPAPGPSRPAPTTGRPAPTTGRPAPAPTTGRPAPTTGRPAPTTGKPAAGKLGSTSTKR